MRKVQIDVGERLSLWSVTPLGFCGEWLIAFPGLTPWAIGCRPVGTFLFVLVEANFMDRFDLCSPLA